MGIRVRGGARTASVLETDPQSSRETMIGVKRPLKMRTPKPPKSAKKKKLLKTTQPLPDEVAVIVNPEPLVQQPAEQDVPIAEQMVSPPKPMPSELELVGQMKDRYRLLLQQAKPEELVEGSAPSLAYLEDTYGHLVEKPFWYDRVCKLAMAYRDSQGGEVSDMSHSALEAAVGHVVPLTPQEQERLHADVP